MSRKRPGSGRFFATRFAFASFVLQQSSACIALDVLDFSMQFHLSLFELLECGGESVEVLSEGGSES